MFFTDKFSLKYGIIKYHVIYEVLSLFHYELMLILTDQLKVTASIWSKYFKLKPVTSAYGVWFCFSCSRMFLALKRLSWNMQKIPSCNFFFYK